ELGSLKEKSARLPTKTPPMQNRVGQKCPWLADLHDNRWKSSRGLLQEERGRNDGCGRDAHVCGNDLASRFGLELFRGFCSSMDDDSGMLGMQSSTNGNRATRVC